MNGTRRRGSAAARSQNGFWLEFSTMFGRALSQMREQPYLMALMIGSLLLSVASFFTTFNGMLNFMPVWLISFCITFAVQALLFVTSWRIGFTLANGEGRPWFTLLVFLICFGTSVFFSWVALFETINDEDLQARTRNTRIHRAVEDTVSELDARAMAVRRERVENLLDSEVYGQWRDSVNQVADQATNASELIEEDFKQKARVVSREIAELERQKASIRRDEAAAQTRVESNQRQLARLVESRPELVERVNRLRSELELAQELVVVQEGLMEAEEKGGASGKGTGRGPVWRDLRDKRNILAAERDTKQRLFDDVANELEARDKTIEDLRASIAAGGVGAADVQIAQLDQEVAQLRSRISGNQGADVNLDAEVEKLRADLAAFATQLELEPFNAAAERCTQLLESLQSIPATRGAAASLSCDRAAMAEYMNPIGVAVSNVKALEAQCVSGGAQAKTVSALNFEQAVEYGRHCIGVSGLAARDVADLRGEIDRLVLEEDPKASRFVKTVNAFWGGEKLAYFALGIAAAIDLLVLFSGLIGAMSTSNSLLHHLGVRANKQKEETLRRLLRGTSDGQAEKAALYANKAILDNVQAINEPTRPDLRAQLNLTQIDNSAFRARAREIMLFFYKEDRTEPAPDNPEVFYIKDGVLDLLRQDLDHATRMERMRAEKAGRVYEGLPHLGAGSVPIGAPVSAGAMVQSGPRVQVVRPGGGLQRSQQTSRDTARTMARNNSAPPTDQTKVQPPEAKGEVAGTAFRRVASVPQPTGVPAGTKPLRLDEAKSEKDVDENEFLETFFEAARRSDNQKKDAS
ncbi:MAG: hypothetical protein MRY63_13500 [Neomegalonema sp.]|nr:hypothetical protein [Neomegalonema sp.]